MRERLGARIIFSRRITKLHSFPIQLANGFEIGRNKRWIQRNKAKNNSQADSFVKRNFRFYIVKMRRRRRRCKNLDFYRLNEFFWILISSESFISASLLRCCASRKKMNLECIVMNGNHCGALKVTRNRRVSGVGSASINIRNDFH